MLIQVALIAIAAVLTTLSLCLPNSLSDDGNAFLHGFVNQELLATLGVIVTITLASAGTIHIELGKMADRHSIDFSDEKRAVRRSAYLLIMLFLAALVLVIVKPVMPTSDRLSAFLNACGIYVVVWAVAVLFDLTRAAFKIS